MISDHILHQCCWPTCVDSLLRCAPALRSRGSIGFHSCLCSCPCHLPCFLCPCHCANRVCCPWSPFGLLFLAPSSLLPLVHLSAHCPRCHVPDPFVPFFACSFADLVPFQAMAHTSSYDMSLLVSGSLCVVFASYAPDITQVHWCRSHHRPSLR